ncbi:hypothetical protein BJX65DRAFT_314960 [Aspergillus insuetus]
MTQGAVLTQPFGQAYGVRPLRWTYAEFDYGPARITASDKPSPSSTVSSQVNKSEPDFGVRFVYTHEDGPEHFAWRPSNILATITFPLRDQIMANESLFAIHETGRRNMKELALRYPDVAINAVFSARSSLHLHLSGELSYQASNICEPGR